MRGFQRLLVSERRKERFQTAPLLFLLLIVSTMLSAQSALPSTVIISGRVSGASGRHPVYVALWIASGFLVLPAQQIRIDPSAAPVFRFQTPPGRWAVSAFEDENENGVLDMGAFGPKEPSGFCRPFHRWRKPRFDDVAVDVNHDTRSADIQLSR